MDVSAFWKIIDDARTNATDDEDFLTRIDSCIRVLEPAELLEFQRHFKKMHTESYSWNLWGAAYLMNGGCSDDGFDYFRAWLLAQGRDTFEKALADPDTLAALENPEGELEEFMYLAPQAYEDKTREQMPDSVFQVATRPKLGEGWDFDDDAEMKDRYPKLFAKYAKG
jgi:hypothetical protein